jgi:GNAT superfamily N-acetyltransferase
MLYTQGGSDMVAMLTIRKFQDSDAQTLSEITRSCILNVNSKDMTQKETKALYDHFTPGRYMEKSLEAEVYVADLDGEPVGTATLDGAWVRSVFVNPSLHGHGIGTALMDHLEKLACERGLSTIDLYASPFAVKFYEKRGYRQVQEAYNEVAGHMVVMEKGLK